MRRALVFVGLVIGCGAPDETAVGFGGSCTDSSECGCHDAAGNDPLCERSSDRLSCLGDPAFDDQICSRSCAADGDCIAEFGANSVCDPFDNLCRP